eukprot:gnl/MRDRNA2_/MRDRNA2_74845_c1_seq1.p1 gnl/MRDRNA2_/MRDRNA2_74845_c1~~gnl/MRDRNA2_/MRDRNA2_74845_c1_seq1.p1  ORF type:complete len:1844 (-),score=231.82 gnl/MRDRNA2_/MRDRNA2_74845_c1_seq1:55-4935(-)
MQPLGMVHLVFGSDHWLWDIDEDDQVSLIHNKSIELAPLQKLYVWRDGAMSLVFFLDCVSPGIDYIQVLHAHLQNNILLKKLYDDGAFHDLQNIGYWISVLGDWFQKIWVGMMCLFYLYYGWSFLPTQRKSSITGPTTEQIFYGVFLGAFAVAGLFAYHNLVEQNAVVLVSCLGVLFCFLAIKWGNVEVSNRIAIGESWLLCLMVLRRFLFPFVLMAIPYRTFVEPNAVTQVLCENFLDETVPGATNQVNEFLAAMIPGAANRDMFLAFAVAHGYKHWSHSDGFQKSSAKFCKGEGDTWPQAWIGTNVYGTDCTAGEKGVAADFYEHRKACIMQFKEPFSGDCTNTRCDLSPCMLEKIASPKSHASNAISEQLEDAAVDRVNAPLQPMGLQMDSISAVEALDVLCQLAEKSHDIVSRLEIWFGVAFSTIAAANLIPVALGVVVALAQAIKIVRAIMPMSAFDKCLETKIGIVSWPFATSVLLTGFQSISGHETFVILVAISVWFFVPVVSLFVLVGVERETLKRRLRLIEIFKYILQWFVVMSLVRLAPKLQQEGWRKHAYLNHLPTVEMSWNLTISAGIQFLVSSVLSCIFFTDLLLYATLTIIETIKNEWSLTEEETEESELAFICKQLKAFREATVSKFQYFSYQQANAPEMEATLQRQTPTLHGFDARDGVRLLESTDMSASVLESLAMSAPRKGLMMKAMQNICVEVLCDHLIYSMHLKKDEIFDLICDPEVPVEVVLKDMYKNDAKALANVLAKHPVFTLPEGFDVNGKGVRLQQIKVTAGHAEQVQWLQSDGSKLMINVPKAKYAELYEPDVCTKTPWLKKFAQSLKLRVNAFLFGNFPRTTWTIANQKETAVLEGSRKVTISAATSCVGERMFWECWRCEFNPTQNSITKWIMRERTGSLQRSEGRTPGMNSWSHAAINVCVNTLASIVSVLAPVLGLQLTRVPEKWQMKLATNSDTGLLYEEIKLKPVVMPINQQFLWWRGCQFTLAYITLLGTIALTFWSSSTFHEPLLSTSSNVRSFFNADPLIQKMYERGTFNELISSVEMHTYIPLGIIKFFVVVMMYWAARDWRNHRRSMGLGFMAYLATFLPPFLAMAFPYRHYIDYDAARCVLCEHGLSRSIPGKIRQRMFLTFAMEHGYENWTYSDGFVSNSKRFCENNVGSWHQKWIGENVSSTWKLGIATNFYDHYTSCAARGMAPVSDSCTRTKCSLSSCMLPATGASADFNPSRSRVDDLSNAIQKLSNGFDDMLRYIALFLSAYTALLLLPLVVGIAGALPKGAMVAAELSPHNPSHHCQEAITAVVSWTLFATSLLIAFQIVGSVFANIMVFCILLLRFVPVCGIHFFAWTTRTDAKKTMSRFSTVKQVLSLTVLCMVLWIFVACTYEGLEAVKKDLRLEHFPMKWEWMAFFRWVLEFCATSLLSSVLSADVFVSTSVIVTDNALMELQHMATVESIEKATCRVAVREARHDFQQLSKVLCMPSADLEEEFQKGSGEWKLITMPFTCYVGTRTHLEPFLYLYDTRDNAQNAPSDTGKKQLRGGRGCRLYVIPNQEEGPLYSALPGNEFADDCKRPYVNECQVAHTHLRDTLGMRMLLFLMQQVSRRPQRDTSGTENSNGKISI